MKRPLYHIIRLALVIIPVLLTMANAMAQTFTVYQGQTIELSVEQKENDTYSWDLYSDPSVNFATTPGNASADEAIFVDGDNEGATVSVTWLKPGIYFYRVVAVNETECTNNVKVGMLEVLESLPTAELALDPLEICINEPSVLTVTFTGVPLWSITLEATDVDGVVETLTYNNIDEDQNPYEITVSPDKTTTYRVIKVTDKYGENLEPSDAVTLTVHPLPVTSPIYVKP